MLNYAIRGILDKLTLNQATSDYIILGSKFLFK